ncbi:MAG: phosphoribosylglycinamide formyltransferase [Ruminococcaceae bacterium]|nr:phosphoribosylglycinamide formyltransferase [Oscillospiraceae bacterium]
MVKIGVLVSGGGTNLQALIDAQKSGIIKSGEIVCVVSNKPDVYALERAKKANIEGCVIKKSDYVTPADFDKAIADYMLSKGVDVIVMAGFLAIVGENLLSAYKDRIINIHPSLIPSFCGEGFYGLKVHEKALEYGVKVTGATVHFVNEIPDGGKIIAQKAVYIEEGDTAEILQKRVMEQAEWIILPEAVEMVCCKLKGDKNNG